MGKLATLMGVSLDELGSYFDDLHGQKLHAHQYASPVAATWPMGFSWSSYVAQEQMVMVCRTAGLEENQLLCLDEACPAGLNEFATVATDDVVFIHSDSNVAADRLESFDQALGLYGIEKNCDKDVNIADEISALGIHLANAPTSPNCLTCFVRSQDCWTNLPSHHATSLL